MQLRILFFLSALIICFLSWSQPLQMDQLKSLKIRNVGPANMSGRITAIDALQSNPKIIFVGAASGGVWKSENGGTAWKPVFDDQPTQNIGAIAIQQDNPNVVWVGTGEGNPRNSMNLGMGIFKSLDGGKTWSHLGLEATKTIHRIVIDPSNPQVVYVGAMGDPFTPNTDRGLYKTTDGGKTWKKILFSNNESGIADLVMDPSNPNKLFAALYQHRRTPYYFTSGGDGSGLYRTMDAGETWEQLGEMEGLPAGELGRIGLAIAPSNPKRIYAKVEATKNALYRSDDGGYQWTMINDNPRFTNNRPFYFQELAVDSKDPNRLYNIYQPLSVSYDGGVSFDTTPMIPADETKGIHADFHSFWMDDNDPEHFIIGGDGGIGITNDHGKSWYFAETIPVAQFYQINVDEDRPYNVYGGMQDNGNWSGPAYTWKRGGIRTLYWQYLVGGDGFYISPDPDNSRFGYGTSQNGNLYRYDKITGYYLSIKPPSPDPNKQLRWNWNSGFATDPFDKEAVYYGSQYLHVSRDKGATWEIISPDLSTNNPEYQKGDYGGLTLDLSGAEMYNSILAIAPSPVKTDKVWVGTDDGQVHLTQDAGETWTNLTTNVKGMPKEAWIARISASAYDAQTAWMVVNNYRKGDYAPYLFKTTNDGISWERVVDGSDVKGYALSFIQDPVEPNLMFLGTENGLWVSIDAGATWTQFENGFPSVSTMDLKIQKAESALIVGTFGRAIWVLDDLLTLREIAGKRITKSVTALPMNDAVQVKGLFINPPGNIWSGFNTTFEGENKVFQKTEIPVFVKDASKTGTEVSVSIYDSNQQKIKELEAANLHAGLNYIIWRLDEQSANLPGAWVHEYSRGIPVLPGSYTIVVSNGSATDTTTVNVIPDPRFDLDPAVDEALYAYKKQVDVQVAELSKALNSLDSKMQRVVKLEEQLVSMNYTADHPLLQKVTTIKAKIAEVKAVGRTPRPDRQVGAWQTLEVSAYSKLREAMSIARSRLEPPSEQEQQRLAEAAELVVAFSDRVSKFDSGEWKSFMTTAREYPVSWLDEGDN